MLNSFYDKYIFTNNLKYKNNNFFLTNIPFAILPLDVLKAVTLCEDEEFKKNFYYMVKKGTDKVFAERFDKFGLEKKKELDLIKTYFVASGWGNINIVDLKEEGKRAIIVIDNSPFASQVVGKSNKSVDFFLRGILAGIFSDFFDENVDCVESECIAKNDERCKFIIKPREEFDVGKKIVREQLILED